MPLNNMILGETIRKTRKERKISQSKLAEMINKSTTFVSRMERGEKGPSLDTLVLIADCLRVSLDTLLEKNRIAPPNGKMPGLEETLSGCNTYEQYILMRSVTEIRRILQEGENLRNPGI